MTDIKSTNFYWRHATMNSVIKYDYKCLDDFIPPLTRLDGFIHSWLPGAQGLRPFSSPDDVTPIFRSDNGKEIKNNPKWNAFSYDTCDVDKHHFYWLSSEEDAKDFLYKYFNEIFMKYSSNQ
jgi:hypothetical protein